MSGQFDPAAAVKLIVGIRDRLADLKREYDEKRKPEEARKELLEGILLEYLEKNNFQNVKTVEGTFYKTTTYKASLSDPEALIGFIKATGLLELLERRASVTAVRAYAEEHNELPPGVQLNGESNVNVNRVTGRDYKLAG